MTMDLVLPSRGPAQFNMRLPQEVHDQIKADALANGRSMNSEILYRLSTWSPPEEEPVAPGGGNLSIAKTREALALVRQLETAAHSAYEACQKLGIKLATGS